MFLWWQTSSFLCSSSVSAQLSHPHKRMLVTVALYSQTCSFAGISLLHNTHFIIAKAPFAWLMRRWMSRSSFNDRVKIVPRYLNLWQYEKNSNSLTKLVCLLCPLLLLSFLVGGYTLLLFSSYHHSSYHSSGLLIQIVWSVIWWALRHLQCLSVTEKYMLHHLHGKIPRKKKQYQV